MDIDKIVTLTEKYLREFVLYIVSFFSGKGASAEDTDFDDMNRSVIFALISGLVGSYLWNRYVAAQSGHVDDLIGVLTDNLVRWLTLGLVLFAILRMLRVATHILPPILSALKVLAVAHIIASFAGYLGIKILGFFAKPGHFDAAANASATIAYLIQLLVVWIYIPREISAICGMAPKWKRVVASVAFAVMASLPTIIRYAVQKAR